MIKKIMICEKKLWKKKIIKRIERERREWKRSARAQCRVYANARPNNNVISVCTAACSTVRPSREPIFGHYIRTRNGREDTVDRAPPARRGGLERTRARAHRHAHITSRGRSARHTGVRRRPRATTAAEENHFTHGVRGRQSDGCRTRDVKT